MGNTLSCSLPRPAPLTQCYGSARRETHPFAKRPAPEPEQVFSRGQRKKNADEVSETKEANALKRKRRKAALVGGAQFGASLALTVLHPHPILFPVLTGLSACRVLQLCRGGNKFHTVISGGAAFGVTDLAMHSLKINTQPVELVLCVFAGLAPVLMVRDIFATLNQPPEGDDAVHAATDASSKANVQYRMLKRIFSWAAEDKWLWLAAYSSLILTSIVSTTMPVAFTRLVASVASPTGQTANAVLRLTGTLFTVTFISSAQTILFANASTRLGVRVQKKYMTNILRQDMEFFHATTTGDIITQGSAATSVTAMVQGMIPTILRTTVSTATAFIILSNFNVKLALITIIGVPFDVAMSWWYAKFSREYAEKAQKLQSQTSTCITEMVGSMKTVRMFSAEDEQTKKFWSSVDAVIKLRTRNNWILAGSGMIDVLLPHITSMMMFVYAGHLAHGGEIDVSQLLTISMYQGQLTRAFESVARVWQTWGTMMGTTKKCFEYMDRDPKYTPRGDLKPEKIDGLIELKNVRFTYMSNNHGRVLHDFSLTIQPGEVVALVGPSGGGKSTVINLLLGLYEVESGSVMIDGRPINEYDPIHYYTRIVSVVDQDPVLFSCSFKENIALGLPEGSVTQDDIEEACKQANAHDFIMSKKEGYDTNVGRRGEQLSGGQKQRVAIARALVRNPSILLLDEASSALDAESESLVFEALGRLMKGRTSVIVAHRLSTIQNADRILVIDKGRIVQEGTHTSLLAQGGIYANLIKRQMMDGTLQCDTKEE